MCIQFLTCQHTGTVPGMYIKMSEIVLTPYGTRQDINNLTNTARY